MTSAVIKGQNVTEFKVSLKEVPPPDAPPEHLGSSELGVLACLRVSEDCDMYRCANCSQMQKSGSCQVWVPDGVRPRDPAWSIQEIARKTAFNGDSSAWCLACARRLGADEISSAAFIPDSDLAAVRSRWPSLWRRIFG